jgi:hypothetical protein
MVTTSQPEGAFVRISITLDLSNQQLETISRRVVEARKLLKEWSPEDELIAMLKQSIFEAQRMYDALDNMDTLRSRTAHERLLSREQGGADV